MMEQSKQTASSVKPPVLIKPTNGEMWWQVLKRTSFWFLYRDKNNQPWYMHTFWRRAFKKKPTTGVEWCEAGVFLDHDTLQMWSHHPYAHEKHKLDYFPPEVCFFCLASFPVLDMHILHICPDYQGAHAVCQQCYKNNSRYWLKLKQCPICRMRICNNTE